MKYLSTFLLFSLMCIGSVSTPAQDPAHWYLTDEEGLPSMTVYQILQDHDGYIWMGTSNGICRYDGKEFEYFSHRSMNDKEIIHLKIDQYNQIWFRNLSNQTFIIRKTEVTPLSEILTLAPEEEINEFGFIDNYLYTFTNEKNDKWKSKITRYKINPSGQLSEKYTFKRKIFVNRSLSFYNNQLTFTGRETRKGMNKFFGVRNDSDQINLFYPTSDQDINLFYLSQVNDHLFFQFRLNENEVWRLENGNQSKEIELSAKNSVTGIYNYDQHTFILTRKGFLVSNDNHQFLDQKLLFKNLNCNIIFKDNENNYWIGTTGNGVIFIPAIDMIFFTSQNSDLPEDQVFSLYWNELKDQLFIGQNEAKISILDTNSIQNFGFNSSGRVLKIVPDENNIAYLAIDSKSLRVKNFLNNSNQYSIDNEFYSGVKTFFIDSKKNLFIGSSRHVWKFNPTEKLEYVELDKTDFSRILLKKRTYCFGEDFQNRIWIGTTEGIYIYDHNNVFTLSKKKETSLNISSITSSQDSIMWISTLGDGIIGYKNDQEVERYNTENGLSSNNCKKVIIDKNKLWIATDNGIDVLNRNTNKIKTINKTDGLPSNDIIDLIIARDKIWIGTSKGLINFPKTLNHQNEVSPPILITSFKIWEKDTTLTNEYDLNYHQNSFQINYVGLGFRAKGNITYQYKLQGIDQNWVTTNSRIVRYPNVDPGKYTFEVYAINEDGIKSKSPARITIFIATPWWMTWWFWIFSGFTIIGIISAFFYWRTKRIQEKERMEQQFAQKVNALEQKALQLQMNPHFIYNTLNAIQYFLTVNESKHAMLYLSRFAKMIRKIFEQSKKNYITIEEEIEFLKIYLNLEQLRFKDQIEVEINLDDQVKHKSVEYKIPPLLLQPLIENAFKHGLFQKEGKGLIKIDFKLDDTFLFCTIEDDGVGRQKAKEKDNWKPKDYVSSGINTTQERLKILNDLDRKKAKSTMEIIDLYDESNNPKGTRVQLKIKYQRS